MSVPRNATIEPDAKGFRDRSEPLRHSCNPPAP
jgi:hypothetical protein